LIWLGALGSPQTGRYMVRSFGTLAMSAREPGASVTRTCDGRLPPAALLVGGA
jgi:hypothetical protein